MLPGEGVSLNMLKEVSFQLVSMSKNFVSKPMYAVTTPSVGNPFNRVDFNLERHAYLEGLKFADKYPSTGKREFEMVVSKPYFFELERKEEIKIPNPSLHLGVCMYVCIEVALRGDAHGIRHSNWAKGSWVQYPRGTNGTHTGSYLRTIVRFLSQLYFRQLRVSCVIM